MSPLQGLSYHVEVCSAEKVGDERKRLRVSLRSVMTWLALFRLEDSSPIIPISAVLKYNLDT
eukprot:3309769-Amphidinium_carterae.3